MNLQGRYSGLLKTFLLFWKYSKLAMCPALPGRNRGGAVRSFVPRSHSTQLPDNPDRFDNGLGPFGPSRTNRRQLVLYYVGLCPSQDDKGLACQF